MKFRLHRTKDGIEFNVTLSGGKARSCDGKVRYSKESAVKASANMEKKTGEQFDVYECRFCKRWHIGHSLGV